MLTAPLVQMCISMDSEWMAELVNTHIHKLLIQTKESINLRTIRS